MTNGIQYNISFLAVWRNKTNTFTHLVLKRSASIHCHFIHTVGSPPSHEKIAKHICFDAAVIGNWRWEWSGSRLPSAYSSCVVAMVTIISDAYRDLTLVLPSRYLCHPGLTALPCQVDIEARRTQTEVLPLSYYQDTICHGWKGRNRQNKITTTSGFSLGLLQGDGLSSANQGLSKAEPTHGTVSTLQVNLSTSPYPTLSGHCKQGSDIQAKSFMTSSYSYFCTTFMLNSIWTPQCALCGLQKYPLNSATT